MPECSIADKLHIVPGTVDDYKQLARYHYRAGRPGPITAVYALKSAGRLPGVRPETLAGAIVYSRPVPSLRLRNLATLQMFAGLDRSTQLSLVNANIRCISRVIIEPRFRALGLACRLVRETMPAQDVPIVEASAVMGMAHPFFERAGMTAYTAPPSKRHARMIEAFSSVGIEQDDLIDPPGVHEKLAALRLPETAFIEREITMFVESYPKQRKAPPSLERTRFVLSKLTARPTYYIWFNNEVPLRTSQDARDARDSMDMETPPLK